MKFYDDIRVTNVSIVTEKHETSDFDFRCEKRAEPGFVAITEGDGIFSFDGKKYNIKSGHIIVVDKGDTYGIKAGDTGISYVTSAITLYKNMTFRDFGIPPLIDSSKNTNVLNKIKNSAYTWDNRQGFFVMETRILVEDILLDFLNLSKSQSLSERKNPRILPAAEYIKKNYDTKITNEFLADLCNMSVTHFRRIFKENFGVSPMQYHEKIRMHWAVIFLQSRMFTVSEISEKLGYSDVYYFSNTFKKHTGNTPSYYKNK